MAEQKGETVPVEVEDTQVYDAAYVKKLREENAAARVQAKEAAEKAESASKALVALQVKDSVAGVLADPSDLLMHRPDADIFAEDGSVDTDKVKAEAEALVAAKPYLKARVFGGDIGQGTRGVQEEPARSFHDILMAHF